MIRCLVSILAVLLLAAPVGPASAQIYLVNREKGTIGEYDAQTGAVINSALVSGLSEPHGLTLAEGALFVTQYGTGTVAKFEAKTGAPINANLVVGLSSPQATAVLGHDLYVSSLSGDGFGIVGKYDATTGAPINAGFITRIRSPMQMAVYKDQLFVAYGDGLGAIGKFNAATGVPINDAFIPYIPDCYVLAQTGNSLWVPYRGAPGWCSILKYDADTGLNAMGYRMPLVMRLGSTGELAVSGDVLYSTAYESKKSIVETFNASTGTLINPSLIVGTEGRFQGIAVVPTDAPQGSELMDDLSLLSDRRTYMRLEFMFWRGGSDVGIGALLLTVVAFLGFFFWSRARGVAPGPEAALENAPPEGGPIEDVPLAEVAEVAVPAAKVVPAAAAVPTELPIRKLAIIGGTMLLVALAGGLLSIGSLRQSTRRSTSR